MTVPVLARPTAQGREYVHPVTGERVPSVTTIISGGVPKPALPRWSAKAAAEYADRSWDILSALSPAERVTLIKGAPWREAGAKADLGSAVHDAVDAWCTDRPMPSWSDGVVEHMEGFMEFLEAREPTFLANEATVWNRAHGYAGTLDFLATINSRLTLVDVKTGKAVYPEVALQLEALARAEVVVAPDGTETPMPRPDVLAVLHLRPKSWALVPVASGEESWRAFLAAAEVTRWSRDTAPVVLGPRLREPS